MEDIHLNMYPPWSHRSASFPWQPFLSPFCGSHPLDYISVSRHAFQEPVYSYSFHTLLETLCHPACTVKESGWCWSLWVTNTHSNTWTVTSDNTTPGELDQSFLHLTTNRNTTLLGLNNMCSIRCWQNIPPLMTWPAGNQIPAGYERFAIHNITHMRLLFFLSYIRNLK